MFGMTYERKRTQSEEQLEGQTVHRVSLDTDPSGADISLIINMSGDVMYIDFGPSIGCGPFTIDNTNSDFEEQVRWFMEKLLEEDLEVFKIMCSVLVGKWLEMAESVTKDIMY